MRPEREKLERVPAPTAPRQPSSIAVPILAITVISILTGNLVQQSPKLVAYSVVVATGAVVTRAFPRADAGTWLLALIPASAAVGSPLVPGELVYSPAGAAIGAAFFTWWVQRGETHTAWRFPIRPVAWGGVAYLVWTFVAAAAAHRLSTSAAAVGTAVTALVAFVVAPTLLAGRRRQLVDVVVSTTTVLAGAALLLWATGPVVVFGRELGRDAPNELVWLHDLTGIIVPRAAGVFGAPGYQSLAVMSGLAALVASPLGGRANRRWWVGVVISVHVVALTLAMSRGGWLGLVVGAGLVMAVNLAKRTFLVWPAVVLVVFVVLLGAVSLSVLGTVDRSATPSSAVDEARRSGAAGTIDDVLLSRGGLQLDARDLLWRGSLDAISVRPIVGHGPGRNAPAIAPFVPGVHYDRLGSHNTLLRVAVEIGVPGAVAFLVFLLTALVTMISRAHRSRDSTELALTAIAVALTVASMTETLLLGGLAFANLLWALSIGVMVTSRQARR